LNTDVLKPGNPLMYRGLKPTCLVGVYTYMATGTLTYFLFFLWTFYYWISLRILPYFTLIAYRYFVNMTDTVPGVES